ncbi:MAG: MATE family efflux transporter, partial [Roseburia sp.]
MKKRREEMLTAPVEKLICRMALPTILGMLVTAVYSMTDTFFIGLLKNTTLTAAVGIVFYFMSLVQAVGFLFGYGSGNYIARCIGQDDEENAGRMAATGFVFAVGAGILIMGAGYLFLAELINILGGSASTELNEATREMLLVFLTGVPGMTGALCLYNQLRLEGNVGRAILGMGTGMLLNMVLDPILILGIDMGVSGAALATVIGQYVGLIVLWFISFRGDCIPVRPMYCVVEKEILKELFCGGSPNFLRQSITTISGILLNHVAGFYGDTVIAAFTVVNRILSMLTAG